ncbi:hypothetical protein PSDVSF_15220 [Pseudodesulfovibrio sediminis]|uniref:Uncharacterized protein n=2 Tax=Pseudodesulfovibrio sediminis TaxID=2810563 RepID=A0ABM7P5T0_9BACT|nr:hypothetical protein PSDVSF_15220 [Pseudodesulfovibrio sediminis]
MFWDDTPKKITAYQVIDSIRESGKPEEKALQELLDRLAAFEATFWDHQKACWRSFHIWEFGGPLLLSLSGTLGLLGRIVFDLFLRCPAVR